MSKKDKAILVELTRLRKAIKENFQLVRDFNELPEKFSGSLLKKTAFDPELTFHFLEFIFEEEYVDIMKTRGFTFIDDKTQWEYFLKSPNGHLRIYDWKGYSVSIGSVLGKGADAKTLEQDANVLNEQIKQGIADFMSFRKVQFKAALDSHPFDNFMNAMLALAVLLKQSRAINKIGNGYLESIILLVSLIDTQLRYLILLTRINKRKTKKIDPDFPILFMQTGDEYITERDVFALAEQEVEFTEYDKKTFFKRAHKLYDYRNRAVHRYAISNFQYSESIDIVEESEDLPDILLKMNIALEHEQVRLGVGFLKEDELKQGSEEEVSKELKKIMEVKVDPSVILRDFPDRESMFSDRFEGGINPAFKKFIDNLDAENKESE